MRLAPLSLIAACVYPRLPEQGIERKDLAVTLNRDLDLLFLIDDSPSMADKQANLAASFRELIAVLDTIPDGLPNVHIGVVTSDLGSKGADDTAPGPTIGRPGMGGCANLGDAGNLQVFGAPITGGPFLSDIAMPDGTRQRNYTGELSDVFPTIARAGAGGCGFEQHLEAMKQALTPGHPTNAGFLRPDAYLAVIFVADEDDCSISHSALLGPESDALGPLQSFRCTRFGVVCDQGGKTPGEMNSLGPKGGCHPDPQSPYLTDVARYAEFLRGLKSDPNQIIVAGIMGTTDTVATELRAPIGTTVPIPALAHSCMYVGSDGIVEEADPPIRLKAFLEMFPNQTSASICDRNLSGGLRQFGEVLKSAIGDPCFHDKLADVDGETPGPQYDCEVSVVTDGGARTAIPRCTPDGATASNPPCWRLELDVAHCPSSDNLSLRVEGQAMLASNGRIQAGCITDRNAD